MSRRQGNKSNGMRLPVSLQKELGFNAHSGDAGRGRRRNRALTSRKEQRKAERVGKKAAKIGRRQPPGAPPKFEDEERDELDEIEPEENSADVPLPVFAPRDSEVPRPQPWVPKSILKKRAAAPEVDWDESEDADLSRASSPGLVLDPSSKAFQERAAQDDAAIAALEKKLGQKDKNSLAGDGLEALLYYLSSEDEIKKRKREGGEWLERKRRKATAAGEEQTNEAGDKNNRKGFKDDKLELDDSDREGVLPQETEEGEEEDGFGGLQSDASDDVDIRPLKIRENPYIAPVVPGASTAKYVPPSRRKSAGSESESIQRLRRQIQGHLNKLSEANLISILAEIEKLYQSQPRQDVTSTLIDLLLSLCSNKATLQNTFIILHAAFVAAVYKVIGTDFGAEIVSRLTARLDSFEVAGSATAGKESNNLIGLLSHLFSFHVISSSLVFDYIRIYLGDLSEVHTERLLRIMRDCGPQLRQDDPSALKTIILLMQKEIAKAASTGREMSVRSRFMVETITDLKNNRVRAATNSFGVTNEHITQMRKVLGSLNDRNLRATEPLRLSRDDIANSDKKGKWWLVGASWKGNEAQLRQGPPHGRLNNLDDGEIVSGEPDLFSLAREYKMNTDIRRSIFVAIMSAHNYQDAHVRLLKLRLKRSQEQEISKVLIRCASAEAAYNPYYALIAKKLCSDKKMKMAFHFALWDFFKRMGETREEDESDTEEESTLNMSEIVNIAKMYADLLADGTLNIGVLKVLNLLYLKAQAKTFTELLLVLLVNRPDERQVRQTFANAIDLPQLAEGLKYFLRQHIRHSDLVSKQDRPLVKRQCRIAWNALQANTSMALEESLE